jgi:hypothetical protein
MVEVNEVRYPANFDTIQNFPSVIEITSASGEDINRNRDAILVLERTLGKNPQLGRYTVDPTTATVGQRLDIIENGTAEGRFAFRNINVYDVLKVVTDIAGLAEVDIGASGPPALGVRIAPVFVRGPLTIADSGMQNNEMHIDVPFVSSARENVIQAGSIDGESLLRITDTNANPIFPNRIALEVQGNVLITNGRLFAAFAIEHSQLLGIDTIPRIGVNAIHVTRGDYHQHSRKRDPATGALLNEVDSNPTEDNKGLIDHMDLLNIYTENGQTGFLPVAGVAYHVTNGDGHDHRDGRGAAIDHNFLSNVDPALSNHVTRGNRHSHSSAADDGGAPIDHNSLFNVGFLSHGDIDRLLNVDFANHLARIDPTDASKIDPAQQGLGFHVPQGHVSDPSAHHTRYTDEEALNAQVLISSVTTVYAEGRNTNTRGHIQAIGSGLVSASNAHGLSAADVGALEGFDSQGNLPDFTRQFLENAVAEIISEPSFDVLRGNQNATITGSWTFNNTGGILIGNNAPTPSYATFDYARASKLDNVINHAYNISPIVPLTTYHVAVGIGYDPTGTLIPLTATDVQAAINQLDAEVSAKEDQLSGSNQVQVGEIANDAVTTSTIASNNVTLDKLANQYAITSYTFTTVLTSILPEIQKYGLLVPTVSDGATIDITAMWDSIGLGGGATINIDVLVAGSPILVPPLPQDIGPLGLNFTNGVPNTVPSVPTVLSSGDSIVVSVDGNGNANPIRITVTVHVKFEHVA